jgi:hypothetical protein
MKGNGIGKDELRSVDSQPDQSLSGSMRQKRGGEEEEVIHSYPGEKEDTIREECDKKRKDPQEENHPGIPKPPNRKCHESHYFHRQQQKNQQRQNGKS